MRTLYYGLVESVCRYGVSVWFRRGDHGLIAKLQTQLTSCSKLILGLTPKTNSHVVHHMAGTKTLGELFVECGTLMVDRVIRLPRCALKEHVADEGAQLPRNSTLLCLIKLHVHLFPKDEHDVRKFVNVMTEAFPNFDNVEFYPETIENQAQMEEIAKNFDVVVATDGAVQYEDEIAEAGGGGVEGTIK